MFIIIRAKHIIAAASITAVLAFSVIALTPLLRGGETVTANGGAGSTNWGLGFPKQPNVPPTANASAEELQKLNTYYIGDTTQKTIYLTFDAGYENGYTPAILDTLKAHDVKAAFFLVGNYITSSPDLVRRMADEGHIVGNHTYHHPDMSKISDISMFEAELKSLEDAYRETTGREMPKYYRPPQGKYSENNLKQAQQLGYKTFFWSLAYVDWYVDKQPTADGAFSKLLPRIHDGAVVLLHSTSKTNTEILDELITKWKSEGYVFGTLEDLADLWTH